MTAAEQKAANKAAAEQAAAEQAAKQAETEAADKAAAEAAEAEAKAKADAAKAAEPTSELLTSLKAKRMEHKIAARTFEPDSDGEAAELMEAYKIDQQIKAEIANIENLAKQAELTILRNKRVELNRVQFALYDAMNTADEASKADATAAFEAAREAVETELLAKYATGTKTVSKPAADGSTAASSDTANREMHIANIAAGKTDAESRKLLEAAGVPRSTAWHTVNNYNKSLQAAK